MAPFDVIPNLEQLKAREPLNSGDDTARWRATSAADQSYWLLRQPAVTAGVTRATLESLVQAWAQVNHPAFVRPCVVGDSDGLLFLWRPWVDTDEAAKLGGDQALAATQRIAEALSLAHEQNLVHGRLTSGNVLVSTAAGLKLSDFALSDAGTPAEDMRALGRLLCDWLTGHTPVTSDPQVLNRFLVGYAKAHPLPPQLGQLLFAMLCQPESLTMRQVRNRIDDVRMVMKRVDAASQELWQVDSYAPAAPVAAAASPAADERKTAAPLPWLLGATAVALLIVAVLVISALVPDASMPVAPVAEATPPPAPVTPPPATTVAAPSQYELEVMLRHRDSAQAELDAMINLQLELEEQKVERWAPQAFDAAVARAREGDEPFRAQQFGQATKIYADAHRLMRGIAGLRPLVVGEALERGRLALDDRRSQAAEEAYTLALVIEPDNGVAQVGLERAQTMDELLALMTGATRALDAGQLEAARDLFAKAVALDSRSDSARSGLENARNAIVERNFRRAMTTGLAALEAGDWTRAEQALTSARKIRPGAQAPADALVELSRQRRDASVANTRQLARRAVDEERWEAAIKHFDAMLKRDPNLQVAQEGRTIAVDRLDLDRRLLDFIRTPAGWWSDNGRQEARSLLHDAGAVQADGPRLRDQIRTLKEQLTLAEQPVLVRLESDNACDVVVYKVARLGRFDAHQLRLLPGRYTAVGTRDGYRDVRREFVVPAGAQPQPVQLRCEEQVLAGG